MHEVNIIHYCHSECMPLNSITELPEKEAFEMAKIIGENNGMSFYRFKDFINYYPRRIKTEKYFYDWFIKSGGKPKTKNPLYFVLEGSDFLFNWFDKGKIIKIPLSKINTKHISFTIGDSCSEYNKNNLKEPILKDELYDIINKFNGNINLMLENMNKQYEIKYIECQLWDNKYVNELNI
jgi:hypothetical protein